MLWIPGWPITAVLTPGILLSNSNHKPFKLCYLCDFVSPLGMSVFEIQLLATDSKLLTRLLLSNSNHNPFKMCYLCDFVSPLGMSVFEIPLLATDYKLLTSLLSS